MTPTQPATCVNITDAAQVKSEHTGCYANIPVLCFSAGYLISCVQYYKNTLKEEGFTLIYVTNTCSIAEINYFKNPDNMTKHELVLP